MNDNKVMREKISALADGELSEFETRRILSEIKHNPAYREFWRNIHLVRDLFDESEDILYERDISTNLRSRLRDDISIETNETEERLSKKKNYLMVSLASFVAVVTFSFFSSEEVTFADIASQKIDTAINSPEAMNVLNNSVSDLNVVLQNVETNNRGTLANYKMMNSGETFKLSLYPLKEINKIDIKEATKISYIKRNGKVFVVSVSGNLSAEKKNLILQKANLSAKN
ncbi:sigma-E factor negative regulatory protein [Gammaproteobacteria bacterium]|nr:sigma-E factor negative regulatory protein [Gammaproteobacteria bacterium]